MGSMPIILDDWFLQHEIKKPHQLVETVANHFGSLIFVTNDIDDGKSIRFIRRNTYINFSQN